MLTREQQRQKALRSKMVTIGLWAHLQNLIRDILAGDASLLPELQEMLQYAPPNMKAKIAERLEENNEM